MIWIDNVNLLWVEQVENNTKICSKCLLEKELLHFFKHKSHSDGHTSQCKECVTIHQKKYYNENKSEISKKNREYVLKNYDKTEKYKKEWYNENRKEIRIEAKTPENYLKMSYHNMVNRVQGKTEHSKKYPHLWQGKSIPSKEEFIRWAINDEQFNFLHKNWVQNNYDVRLSPSLDRIDNKKGYELSNIRWITKSLNSKLGNITRRNKNLELNVVKKLLKMGESNEKN